VAVIEDLIAGSLVWVDEQAAEHEYWTPMAITMNLGSKAS